MSYPRIPLGHTFWLPYMQIVPGHLDFQEVATTHHRIGRVPRDIASRSCCTQRASNVCISIDGQMRVKLAQESLGSHSIAWKLHQRILALVQEFAMVAEFWQVIGRRTANAMVLRHRAFLITSAKSVSHGPPQHRHSHHKHSRPRQSQHRRTQHSQSRHGEPRHIHSHQRKSHNGSGRPWETLAHPHSHPPTSPVDNGLSCVDEGRGLSPAQTNGKLFAMVASIVCTRKPY